MSSPASVSCARSWAIPVPIWRGGPPDPAPWAVDVGLPSGYFRGRVYPFRGALLIVLAHRLYADLARGIVVADTPERRVITFANMLRYEVTADRTHCVVKGRNDAGSWTPIDADVQVPIAPQWWLGPWFTHAYPQICRELELEATQLEPGTHPLFPPHPFPHYEFTANGLLAHKCEAVLQQLVAPRFNRDAVNAALVTAMGLHRPSLEATHRRARLDGDRKRATAGFYNQCEDRARQVARIERCAPVLMPSFWQWVEHQAIGVDATPLAALRRLFRELGASRGDWARLVRLPTVEQTALTSARVGHWRIALIRTWMHFHHGLPRDDYLPVRYWLSLLPSSRTHDITPYRARLAVAGYGWPLPVREGLIARLRAAIAAGSGDDLARFERTEWEPVLRSWKSALASGGLMPSANSWPHAVRHAQRALAPSRSAPAPEEG